MIKKTKSNRTVVFDEENPNIDNEVSSDASNYEESSESSIDGYAPIENSEPYQSSFTTDEDEEDIEIPKPKRRLFGRNKKSEKKQKEKKNVPIEYEKKMTMNASKVPFVNVTPSAWCLSISVQRIADKIRSKTKVFKIFATFMFVFSLSYVGGWYFLNSQLHRQTGITVNSMERNVIKYEGVVEKVKSYMGYAQYDNAVPMEAQMKFVSDILTRNGFIAFELEFSTDQNILPQNVKESFRNIRGESTLDSNSLISIWKIRVFAINDRTPESFDSAFLEREKHMAESAFSNLNMSVHFFTEPDRDYASDILRLYCVIKRKGDEGK